MPERSLIKGIVGGLGQALTEGSRKGYSAGMQSFWTYTKDYFAPNKMGFNVDGGRWGANYAALMQPERSQEFAIACNAIARELGCSKYLVERETGSEPQPITDSNDAFRRLIAQPNALHSWQSWIETATLLLLPSGNCYILMDPVSLAGTPMALYLLRPDRTQPIRSSTEQLAKDPLRLIQGYLHYAEDGRRYVFPPERVIHIKLPNPLSDYQGMGMVNLLAQTLEIDFRSMESNLNLFRMGGRLSTVIEGLDDDDPQKLKELKEKIQNAHAGSENAHRVLLLSGNAKVNAQLSGAGPKEADYKATREDISRAVGGMMGVPPLKMGQMHDINRASAVVEQQQFLSNAVWPTMTRFAGAMTIIAKKFNPQYSFRFPMVDVMDPELIAGLVKSAAESGAASPNDIRQNFLQWPRSTEKGMDKHFLFGMQQSIEDGGGQLPPEQAVETEDGKLSRPPALEGSASDGKLPRPPALGGDQEKPVSKEPSEPEAQAPRGKLTPMPKLGEKAIEKVENGRTVPRGTRDQRRFLAHIRNSRPKYEKALTPIFKKHFLRVVEEMAKALEERGGKAAKGIKPESIKAVLEAVCKKYDASGSKEGLNEEALAEYKKLLEKAGQDATSIFGVDMADYTADSVAVSAASARLGQWLTNVDDEVRSQVATMVEEGAKQGLSPWQIANGTTDGSFEGLRTAGQGIAQERAMLIARTETTHLQDAANTAAYNRMGVKRVDVIGCEDFSVMPGETYGCNSQDVPMEALPIRFHPNHNGAVVPRLTEG